MKHYYIITVPGLSVEAQREILYVDIDVEEWHTAKEVFDNLCKAAGDELHKMGRDRKSYFTFQLL
jgi:hypothetical protein